MLPASRRLRGAEMSKGRNVDSALGFWGLNDGPVCHAFALLLSTEKELPEPGGEGRPRALEVVKGTKPPGHSLLIDVEPERQAAGKVVRVQGAPTKGVGTRVHGQS